MSGELSLQSRYGLSDGNTMPVVGFGTYRINPGQETRRSVLQALRVGYRLVDTAALYRNEKDCGAAISQVHGTCESLFVCDGCMWCAYTTLFVTVRLACAVRTFMRDDQRGWWWAVLA